MTSRDDAFLQAILIALQHVHTAEAFLEHGSMVRPRAVGIVLHLGRLKHLAERDAHSLGDRGDVFYNSHT